MRAGLAKAAAILAAIVLSGCAVTEAQQQQARSSLTRRIVADAIAYNEAYSDAVSSQILLNILRARDRLPRQYMSMSGFANSDPDSRGTSASIGGIPLTNFGHEWGALDLGVSRSTTLEPEYNVEPLATDAYTAIVLRPTRADVFAQYWNSGWSRDMVLLLAVGAMQVEPLARNAPPEVYANNASSIRGNCAGAAYDRQSQSGCAYVQAMRTLAGATYRQASVVVETRTQGQGVGICGLIGAYAPAQVVYRTPEPNGGECAPKIVVGDRLFSLSLRSLDGMVFYVGELLRDDPAAPNGAGKMLARVNIAAPGIPGGDPTVPLFRVLDASAAGREEFAAQTTYASRAYVAGPAVSRLCDSAGQNDACTNDVEHGDRSSTVLEFLGGILAVNQSERAVAAPQPFR